jgi:large subunit ribosomal protein L25
MSTDTPTLKASTRDDLGSRTTRRKRRAGVIPGVVYGGGADAVSVEFDEATLRSAMTAHSALIDLKLGDENPQPVLIKDYQRHPVSGKITHVDLLRVRLDVKVQAQVSLELVGTEASPGLRFGGILEQITREVIIEALPNEIPESVIADASAMEIGDTLFVSAVETPEGVDVVSDPTGVVATVSASRVSQQTERSGEAGVTEVVGEAAPAAESGSGDEE